MRNAECGPQNEECRTEEWKGADGLSFIIHHSSFIIAMEILHPKKIVLLGMMTKMPVAGVVWQTVHYLVGLARLGYDVYYVEAHARPPSMLMAREDDDGSSKAAEFIAGVMRRFDLGDRWAFHALHDDGRC